MSHIDIVYVTVEQSQEQAASTRPVIYQDSENGSKSVHINANCNMGSLDVLVPKLVTNSSAISVPQSDDASNSQSGQNQHRITNTHLDVTAPRLLPDPAIYQANVDVGERRRCDVSSNITCGDTLDLKAELGERVNAIDECVIEDNQGADIGNVSANETQDTSLKVKENQEEELRCLGKIEVENIPQNKFVNSIFNYNTDSSQNESLVFQLEIENVRSPSTEADADFEDDLSDLSEVDEIHYLGYKLDGTVCSDSEQPMREAGCLEGDKQASDKRSQTEFGQRQVKIARQRYLKEKCPHCSVLIMPRHMKNHISNKHVKAKQPYVCEFCGVVKPNGYAIKYHIRYVHTKNPKIMKCSECGYQTKYEATYKRHVKSHQIKSGMLERDIECDKCKKMFINKDSLRAHMVTHSEVKPFNCDLCNRGFSQKNNYLVHMARHVPNDESYPQPGVVINKASQVKTSVPLKPDAGNFKRELRFPCDICGKLFRWNHDVKRHMKVVHMGLKQFECVICGKKFVDKAALNIHIETNHEQSSSFSCPFCVKTYCNKFKLKHHVESKHSEKNGAKVVFNFQSDIATVNVLKSQS